MFFTRIFRHYLTFLKLFGFHQRVSPSFVSIICNTMDVKNPIGPPFTFFGTVALFKNLNFIFFSEKFQNSLKGPFLIFFIFCNQLEFHNAQRVAPFTILSLRYSADVGRSRLVNILHFPLFSIVRLFQMTILSES